MGGNRCVCVIIAGYGGVWVIRVGYMCVRMILAGYGGVWVIRVG